MTFGQRVAGVLRLDPATFEEIEHNRALNGQACGVVLLASVTAGLGAGGADGFFPLVREALGALIGWVMFAGVTYLLGARLLPEDDTRTDLGELLRVIGFASAPNFLAVVGVIPIFGDLVRVVLSFWVLATTVVGVRQALDYRSTLRALGVVIIGWLIFVIVSTLS